MDENIPPKRPSARDNKYRRSRRSDSLNSYYSGKHAKPNPDVGSSRQNFSQTQNTLESNSQISAQYFNEVSQKMNLAGHQGAAFGQQPQGQQPQPQQVRTQQPQPYQPQPQQVQPQQVSAYQPHSQYYPQNSYAQNNQAVTDSAFAPYNPYNPQGSQYNQQTNQNPYQQQQDPSQYDKYDAWTSQPHYSDTDMSNAVPKKRKKPKSRKSSAKSLISFFVIIALIFGLAWAMREFVFQAYEIPSGSMEETIMTGDMVFADKVTHNFLKPKRGEILTFKDPEVEGRVLIKRCIATEGQTIDIKNNKLYVDDVEIDEPYTQGKPTKTLSRSKISFPYTIPEGHVWMMGDNRTNSQDSRYYGAIPISDIIGRALFVYWPTSDIKLLL